LWYSFAILMFFLLLCPSLSESGFSGLKNEQDFSSNISTLQKSYNPKSYHPLILKILIQTTQISILRYAQNDNSSTKIQNKT